ncbi:corset-associated protein 17, putative [Trypanosoma brucei gambiense DAL972]|uniref:Microtubule-associated protein n=3 Tax=Trypanosoma brucei TaxID=5691 RepID=D0AAJ8_TRYB9|nr:corset-associated protein 17, putative [Trypanosoma brucei gambiense DAL972]AAL37177.1 corset-associated protein 17 [Trypanosoma brucei]RHW68236.1 cytoskeleton-associated protein 17 [Trypanosoma brucei equiperdum]CBH18699.1 corset-associated protein 17, putative [Trypanosoma brucei gambiense DAL972]|eukprot:XP_011780963.1 corset-associated protein 17, putative [Trypanosoma brucei gambiense DAL972]
MDRKLVEMQAVISRREAEFRKQNIDLFTELLGEMRTEDGLCEKNSKELQYKQKELAKQRAEIEKAEKDVKAKLDKVKLTRSRLAEQMSEIKEKLETLRKWGPADHASPLGLLPAGATAAAPENGSNGPAQTS